MDIEKINHYLTDLNDRAGFLENLRKIISYKSDYFIPAVREDCALFLRWFTTITAPLNILEIGFGAGASAYSIRSGLDESFNKFITLERDINRYNRGMEVLEHFCIDMVDLMHIDGFEYLKGADLKFDMIFLDAVKKDYIEYLPGIYDKLNIGGYLLADNTIFGGKVVDEIVEKKYINGVEKLKEFNEKLSDDKRFISYFFNIGDGISVSKKVK